MLVKTRDRGGQRPTCGLSNLFPLKRGANRQHQPPEWPRSLDVVGRRGQVRESSRMRERESWQRQTIGACVAARRRKRQAIVDDQLRLRRLRREPPATGVGGGASSAAGSPPPKAPLSLCPSPVAGSSVSP